MMKSQFNINPNELKKVRSKVNVNDIYFTSSKWDTREVDGVIFIAVVSQMPNGSLSNRKLWIRKDNMEFVR